MSEALLPRLAEIVEEFRWCEGREKLELLLQYSRRLPPLPAWLIPQRDSMEPVPECMTPVFLFIEWTPSGAVLHFDVPAEAPTVRGYAAMVAEGLRGASPEQMLALPADFYMAMGLHDVLTPQRLNGMAAIVAHLKRLALEQQRQRLNSAHPVHLQDAGNR